MDDLGAGLRRFLMVRVDHLTYPLHFASQIAVMRTRIDAGRNEFRTIELSIKGRFGRSGECE